MNIDDLFVSFKALKTPNVRTSTEVVLPQTTSLPDIEINTSQTTTPKIAKKNDTKTPFSWFLSEVVTPTPTKPVTLVPRTLNIPGWNVAASIEYLNSHAGKAKGQCAGYVWNALEAGGIKGIRGHARDIARSGKLEGLGFMPITRFRDSLVDLNYVPLAGDIVVSAPDNNKNYKGHHVAMYNGQQWVSDFKQNNMDVYGNKDNEWIIYRKTK